MRLKPWNQIRRGRLWICQKGKIHIGWDGCIRWSKKPMWQLKGLKDTIKRNVWISWTFSLVIKMVIGRSVIPLVTTKNLHLYQVDVYNAFSARWFTRGVTRDYSSMTYQSTGRIEFARDYSDCILYDMSSACIGYVPK